MKSKLLLLLISLASASIPNTVFAIAVEISPIEVIGYAQDGHPIVTPFLMYEE